LLVSAYFIRRWYKSYQLRVYGIGRGGTSIYLISLPLLLLFSYKETHNPPLTAKGFQTSVGKVRITPEIAERIQRGEDVSPAEIEAASKKMDELEKLGQLPPSTPQKKAPPPPQVWEDEKPFIDERTPREVSPRRVGGRTSARRTDSGMSEGSVLMTPGTTKRTTRSASRQIAAETKAREDAANEWLPEHITAGNTKKRRGRKA
jgi:hypothetical protein